MWAGMSQVRRRAGMLRKEVREQVKRVISGPWLNTCRVNPQTMKTMGERSGFLRKVSKHGPILVGLPDSVCLVQDEGSKQIACSRVLLSSKNKKHISTLAFGCGSWHPRSPVSL